MKVLLRVVVGRGCEWVGGGCIDDGDGDGVGVYCGVFDDGGWGMGMLAGGWWCGGGGGGWWLWWMTDGGGSGTVVAD